MKSIFVAGAAVAALCAATAAHAGDNSNTGTLEVGYSHASYDVPGLGSNVSANALHVRGGAQFNKNWGVEMEGGFGLGSDSVTVLGTPLDFKQKWELGMYIDGYLPVGANTDLIGRVGYSRTRMTISGPGGSGDGDQNGLSAGVGVRTFPGGGPNGVRVDYTHYFYNDDVKGDVFSVGYVRKF